MFKLYIILISCITSFSFFTVNRPILTFSSIESSSSPWWSTGLPFSCTGCGKCCSNDGEVWLNSDEMVEISMSLGLSPEDFLSSFVAEVRSDWVKLVDGKDNSCIFLGNDKKLCTIYLHRPVQCRTYPFWPSLVESPVTWDSEVVSDLDNIRKWSPEEGGCEGMSYHNTKDSLVPIDDIYRNVKLDKLYRSSYPHYGSGDDKQRMLAKVGIMSTVISDSMSWVFNEASNGTDITWSRPNIRYRVVLSSDYYQIIEKIKIEIFSILTTDESVLSSTLIMTPLAFMNVEDEFSKFSANLKLEVIPNILASSLMSQLKGNDYRPEIEVLCFPKHNQFKESIDNIMTLPYHTISIRRTNDIFT